MDPGSLADDAAAHFFFSDAVPYHRPLAGSPESVEKIGHEEIRAFVGDRFQPEGNGLVVVGDLEPSEVQAMAKDHFGGWERNTVDRPALSSEARFAERRVLVVHRPGSVQSEIRIGQLGASRATPHYFPLRIFNTVLGGAFTSRLMLNLREEQGFTYGVRSRFAFRRGPGPFGISTAVATEVTAPAIREALGELETLVDQGPTEEEVGRARDYIAGVFPLSLETTGQVAARIGELLVYGLPDDYFGGFRDQIRSVSREDATRAGQAALRPEEMVIVVVGDADRIREPLEDLGVGPVQITSPF
jgi:predicted Zn-dependent peptidase